MLKIKSIKSGVLLAIIIGLILPMVTIFSTPEAHANEEVKPDYFTLTPKAGEWDGNQESPSRKYILEDPSLKDIPYLIEYAIKFMLRLSGIGAVMFIFGGAFQYISGATIETKQKGKTQIMYAVIGLVLITLSYALVQTITQVLF